jgi:hypothetical protein
LDDGEFPLAPNYVQGVLQGLQLLRLLLWLVVNRGAAFHTS